MVHFSCKPRFRFESMSRNDQDWVTKPLPLIDWSTDTVAPFASFSLTPALFRVFQTGSCRTACTRASGAAPRSTSTTSRTTGASTRTCSAAGSASSPTARRAAPTSGSIRTASARKGQSPNFSSSWVLPGAQNGDIPLYIERE